MSQEQNYSNRILIAMPSLKSNIFSLSVVYVYSHNSDGATGVVLNVPIAKNQAETWGDQLGWYFPDRINHGGPEASNLGYVLHTSDYAQEYTVTLNDDVSYTSSKDIIDDISCGSGPSQFILMTGYASWDSEQLESEIKDGLWAVADYDPEYLFRHEEREDYWVSAVDIHAEHETRKLLSTIETQ